jgi:C1A family cysteine protease
MPNIETEKLLGGHAVMAVMYDDIKKVFGCRNSWGDKWGDKGYFYLPYDFILDKKMASDFWIITSIELSSNNYNDINLYSDIDTNDENKDDINYGLTNLYYN